MNTILNSNRAGSHLSQIILHFWNHFDVPNSWIPICSTPDGVVFLNFDAKSKLADCLLPYSKSVANTQQDSILIGHQTGF